MKTILIVEDEVGIADALEATLADEGYRTHAATDGRKALELMNEQSIDLVLLDYMMPVLDGGQTLKAMRDDPRLEPIPVILLSALTEASIRAEAVVGYQRFMRKPFDLGELLNAIAALLT